MLTRPVLYCPQCKKALVRRNDNLFCPSCSRAYPVINGIPSFVDRNAVVDSFDASAFGFLFEVEQRHFWHVGRREIILDVLRKNVPHLSALKMLEIGCGNGSVLAHLKQNGVDIEGGDIFLEALKFSQQRVGSVNLYHLDVLALPFIDSFDIIGLFDVLEHIDEDERALREIGQALKSGGMLILTVPANKFLWGYFDAHSYHKRRYSKRELAAKLERNGFIIKKLTFFMFFLFPLLAAIRMAGNILHGAGGGGKGRAHLEERNVPIINDFFLGILGLEKWLLRYFTLPFGASLLVLAQKK